MDSGNLLSLLFKDPVINRLIRAAPPAQARGGFPAALLAKVTALRGGNLAVLQRAEGEFTARLDARVEVGEILRLKYEGVRQGRPLYRILARYTSVVGKGESGAREPNEPLLFALLPAVTGGKNNPPALVRLLPRNRRKGETAEALPPILEIFFDTENFGLVLVRFYLQGENRLQCRFLVESREAGEALQAEADRLVDEAAGETGSGRKAALQWSVAAVGSSAAEALHDGGLNINRKA